MDAEGLKLIKNRAVEAISDLPASGIVGLEAMTACVRALEQLNALSPATARAALDDLRIQQRALRMLDTAFEQGKFADAFDVAFGRCLTVVDAAVARLEQLDRQNAPAGPASAPPPRALAALTGAYGTSPHVSPAGAPVLGWEETPPLARLVALRFGGAGAPVDVYVCPRAGCWLARWSRGGGRRPSPFVGVVEDALVFAGEPGGATDQAFALAHTAREPSPLPGFDDEGLGAGFVRPPVLHPGGVAVWGPFAYAIPAEAAAKLLARPEVITAALTSISAEADGERQCRIVHRTERETMSG